MALSTGKYLESFHDSISAIGAKAINSDFTIQIVGWPESYMLCKQAPWPELSSQGEIEVPTPLGGKMWQPQQVATAQQGQVTFQETVKGNVEQKLVEMLTKGGFFDAWIYEGTPTNYIRRKLLKDCFLQLDAVDRDWENRSQVLTFSGTMFYHYFGEVEEGSMRQDHTYDPNTSGAKFKG